VHYVNPATGAVLGDKDDEQAASDGDHIAGPGFPPRWDTPR
jgi:hypothetical protein